MTTEYCWSMPGIEPREPFDSVEDAEQDARESLDGRSEDGPHTVEIRRCDPIMRWDWADCYGAEDVLESMDQFLCDTMAFDDRVFEIAGQDMEKAQNDLSNLLRRWAAEYVTTSGQWQEGELVKVVEVAG